MNPYDFVRIDWTKMPDRKAPQWHHRLTATGTDKLYSGHLEVELKAERPLFSPAPGAGNSSPIPFLHRKHNSQETYIIPGTSLKGMLRTVTETLSNSCLSMFGANYRYEHMQEKKNVDYSSTIPVDFRKCDKHQHLCPACRIFGMMETRQNAKVFLGKVNIGDALSTTAILHDPIYTIPLTTPKPHHTAFYLDPAKKYIAGRKFYFHQKPNAFTSFPSSKSSVNRYIHPLDTGSCFTFRLDFVNLEAEEFELLLLALVLEPGMRHQIGYGKPMGLGSIQITPTKLTLIDYARRYTRDGSTKSQETHEGEELKTSISKHTDPYKAAHLLDATGQANDTLTDLRRIWGWPPKNITYRYPDRAWFDDHPLARISQTP